MARETITWVQMNRLREKKGEGVIKKRKTKNTGRRAEARLKEEEEEKGGNCARRDRREKDEWTVQAAQRYSLTICALVNP